MPPRTGREERAMLAKADKIQPRMARAYVKAVGEMQSRIKIAPLAKALEARNVDKVMDLLDEWEVFDDPLVPLANIVEDTVLEGGKLGANQVNRQFEKMLKRVSRGGRA